MLPEDAAAGRVRCSASSAVFDGRGGSWFAPSPFLVLARGRGGESDGERDIDVAWDEGEECGCGRRIKDAPVSGCGRVRRGEEPYDPRRASPNRPDPRQVIGLIPGE